MSLVTRLRLALAQADGIPPLLVGDDGHSDVPRDQGGTPAAVLVPIMLRPEPTLILTVRPETLRQHAGQVAFPGGRVDPGDVDVVDAALREAEEEIALSRGEVEVIGTADPYRTVTGYDVTPVIGLIGPDVPLRANADEVSDIFEAPLAFVLDPANQLEREVEWRGRQRLYHEILWGERRIWGATAAMIVNLGRRLAAVQ